ncbi:hypothetical protein [Streptomyces sp. NPDC001914]|uniref:hypothetical protein n=1 Tax=Streptomyces sp. NPDC001914 TaxID=3364623 RepID=UPI0036C4620E
MGTGLGQRRGGPFVETADWTDQEVATLRAAGYETATRDQDDDYLGGYRKSFGDADEDVWFPGTSAGRDPHQQQRMRDEWLAHRRRPIRRGASVVPEARN